MNGDSPLFQHAAFYEFVSNDRGSPSHRYDTIVVQIGLLGVPQLRLGNGEHGLVGEGVAGIHSLGCALGNQLVVCIIQLDGNGNRFFGELEADSQRGLCTVQVIGDEVVADVGFRALQNVHIPEDTGSTELILVFQVTAVTPFQYQNCQSVLTVYYLIGNVKLGGGVGNLVVAQVLAVEPSVQAGVYTFKVQVSPGAFSSSL